METKQAIQSSAKVVRITSVSPGDVYKRFDTSYEDRTYYGLVKAVHNDGEKAIIEALEFCYKYSSLDVSHKILNGSKDYTIFPSSPEELNFELDKARIRKIRSINEKEEEVKVLKREVEDIDKLISGETQKSLKEMSYKEITQSQFEERKKLI